MDAIGMIETRGLIGTIEAADAMLKAAEVRLLERTFVKGGIVTVIVTGDVAAVKASVDAGAAAVSRISPEILLTTHVIPRPHANLAEAGIVADHTVCVRLASECELRTEQSDPGDLNMQNGGEESGQSEESIDLEGSESEVTKVPSSADDNEPDSTIPEWKQASAVKEGRTLHRKEIDDLLETEDVDTVLGEIAKMKVLDIRMLAREYKDFVLSGRDISRANRDTIMEAFWEYLRK